MLFGKGYVNRTCSMEGHLKLQDCISTKVVMQGKLIAVAYTRVHIEPSSLLAEFVNKNRCMQCLFSIRGG